MVFLGYGKFVRADRIYALEPIEGDDRGDGRRTKVWIDGMAEPMVASRTERTILADMGEATALAMACGGAGRTRCRSMSDRDVQLISAGQPADGGGLMGPAGEFGDTDVCSNVSCCRGGRTVLIDTAAGGLDDRWEGATEQPRRSARAALLGSRTSTPSS